MAKGIGLAGGFGAGGARDALVDLIAQRMAQEKFDEQKRAQAEQESLARSHLQQTGSLARERMSIDERQFGERLGLDVRRLDQDDKQYTERMGHEKEELGHRRNESARDQTNRDRSFGEDVRQFDVTSVETGRHHRAVEGAARDRAGMGRVARQVVGADDQGRPVTHLVDAQGNIIRTIPRAANAIVAGQLAPIRDYIDLIDDALKTGTSSGWSGTGPVEARLRNALPGGAGFTQGQELLRNKIGNLFSGLAHERFGGALTEHEIVRARSFLPEPTDSAGRLQAKLTNLKQFMEMKFKNLSGSMPRGREDVDIGTGSAPTGAAMAPRKFEVISVK